MLSGVQGERGQGPLPYSSSRLVFLFFFYQQGIALRQWLPSTKRAGLSETLVEHASSRYELAFRARDA